MPQIVPMKDLRNTNEISQMCHASNEPIFVTKNGYGDLVVMSIESYEDMLHATEVDNAITESEVRLAKGEQPIEAHEALAMLRRKYI